MIRVLSETRGSNPLSFPEAAIRLIGGWHRRNESSCPRHIFVRASQPCIRAFDPR